MRQTHFIITKSPLSPRTDLEMISLSNGQRFYYQKDLNLYRTPDSRALLLGIAWQTDGSRRSPAEELEKLVKGNPGRIPEDAVFSMEESWCGRYVIIVEDRLYLDANGLLGIYYSEDFASDSLLLAAECFGMPLKPSVRNKKGNYMFAPLTQYPGVKRLLASQTLELSGFLVMPRRLLPMTPCTFQNEEERNRAIMDLFKTSLANMAACLPEYKLLLALTGGYDSRTALAMLEYAGVDYSCYTLEHPQMSSGDRALPGELCKALGREHIFVARDPKKYDPDVEAAYLHQTLEAAADGDTAQFAHGQYQELSRRYGKVALIRSSIWEISAVLYENFIDKDPDFEKICRFLGVQDGSILHGSLTEYFRWIEEHPEPELEACERFYWDQRSGTWLSMIEQSFDFADEAISLQPCNCRRLLQYLLGFPRELRCGKKHQKLMIHTACPELSEIDFDVDTHTAVEKLKIAAQKGGQFVSFCKKYGVSGAIGATKDYFVRQRRKKN